MLPHSPERVVRTDALSRQLLHLGRQIESFGTGGGLFRPMLGRFLTAVSEATGDERYLQSGQLFADSGRLWQTLGRGLLEGAAAPGGDRQPLVDAVVDTVRSVMDIEKRALVALSVV